MYTSDQLGPGLRCPVDIVLCKTRRLISCGILECSEGISGVYIKT